MPVWLICDGNVPDADPPLNFRLLQDNFYRENQAGVLPTRIGLLFLRASGSGQFSEKNLIWIKEKLKKYKLTVIDLRQESHGLLNGLAVSWYMGENQLNRGKTLTGIEEDETSRLASLLEHRSATVFRLSSPESADEPRVGIDPELVRINDAITEKELCADLDIYYVRLPVADYQHPADEEVDRFVRLVKSMGKDSWLHIHCREGDGRTTAFLAMFDMMHNAKAAGLEDIVKRQWLLGGIDLLSPTVSAEWKSSYAQERANFIRHFYQYCQNSDDEFSQSWSEWQKGLR